MQLLSRRIQYYINIYCTEMKTHTKYEGIVSQIT